MLEQSVKLSRLIIFYFISNFLIYAPILPNREPKTSAFRSVFVFRAVFQLLYSCFVVLQTPTIAVFARTWSGADPNFEPLIRRIWLAPSEFLCLLANQNVTFVTFFCNKLPFFCTQLPSFCTLLPKNCISVSQSQSRNFFMYIIRSEVIQVTSKSDEHAARVQFEITSMISVQNCTPLVLKKWCNLKQKGNKMNWCDIINGLVFWYWFAPIEHAGK